MSLRGDCLLFSDQIFRKIRALVMHKVSVLIAVYNGAATLEKAIASFLEQTYSDTELIIIDGGSTDGTQAILKLHDAEIDYWVSEEDRGIYHAWNKALNHATGEWICFIGADDYWAYPDAIADLVKEGVEKNVELVSGKVAIVNAQLTIMRKWGRPWNWSDIKRHHCIAHPGMMHHKSCFERNGLYNEKYRIAGDYDFSLRLGKTTRAAFIDKVFVFMGDKGLSHTMVNKTLSEVRIIQASHPEIGRLKANMNYLLTHLIVAVKKIMGML
jgi:glycosyltransferase involved in cell wall biosynthesis